MLNPTQKQIASQFQGKNKEEQCKQIADYCNQNGITKEQLQNIVSMITKR